MEYPKINTIWKRNAQKKSVIIEGDYSQDEFPNIILWEVSEKIDGMNIRVEYSKDGVRFNGRSDEAMIPAPLLEVLIRKFTVAKLHEVFDLKKADIITIFAEGFGPGIQSGGKYCDKPDVAIFDINIDGIWLKSEMVTEMAKKLDIKRAPIIGRWTQKQIESFVKNRPQSIIGKPGCPMEGVVCRSSPLVLDRMGEPVVFKLKVRDYDALERQSKKADV